MHSHRWIKGPVHSAYNLYFSACFFSQYSIFLSQQISQQCFSIGLSVQPNGAKNGWHQTGRKSPVTFMKEVRESGLLINMLKF
jgi:hypothetical protein